ncbi:50S ribosomal protein L15e [Nanoarchaeota archaeon]
MVNGLMHYIKEAWRKPDMKVLRAKMTQWRRECVVERIDKPTRLDRARALGYKAKPGFVVVRVRLMRGGRRHPVINAGRRSKRNTNKKVLMISYKGVAERRANAKYPNLEVLNSYWVGQEGINYFFEVIMVDPSNPHIKADKKMNWISKGTHKGRTFRGLTSAGKKSRGLRVRGRNRRHGKDTMGRTALRMRKSNKKN